MSVPRYYKALYTHSDFCQAKIKEIERKLPLRGTIMELKKLGVTLDALRRLADDMTKENEKILGPDNRWIVEAEEKLITGRNVERGDWTIEGLRRTFWRHKHEIRKYVTMFAETV